MRKNGGITLIVLIITIIVLLILAGVGIATLTGDNGLFARAKQAKEESSETQEQENKILVDYESKISQYVDATNNNGGILGESSLINDFNINVFDIRGNSVKIDLAEGTNTENIIGYIICIGNKSLDVVKTLPYTITGLEKNTQYKDIHVIAIDNQKKGKESNKKTVSTPETNTLLLYDSTVKNNILESGFVATNYRLKGCGGSRVIPDIDGHTMKNLGGSSQGTVHYNQLINVGEYNYLYLTISEATTTGYMPSVLFTKTETIEDLYDYEILDTFYLPSITQKTTLTFDISKLTGNHYLALFLNAGSTLTVDKIELSE